ncbi:hypothetical protein ACFWBF_29820 [Streptomyces sp. NPDC060028]|uniref:hypothetical protein n=1 Tax=Streptomyces sp. NPDC060028 TaxID=3347041 RepID=UPI0036C2BFE2
MNRRIATVACAAALTFLAAGTASAAPPQPGQTYVMAPRDTPDQWLGDNDWMGSVVCQASRLWYGSRHDNAVWQVTGHGDGSISLVNMDAEQNRMSLASAGGGIRIDEGNGEQFNWDVIAGPGGTVALQNRQTRRFLSVAAGTVVGAVQAYYWYMTNARP